MPGKCMAVAARSNCHPDSDSITVNARLVVAHAVNAPPTVAADGDSDRM